MLTARERHSALVETMVADGTLTDTELIDTFRSVPRHRFIPDTGALTAHGTVLNATNNPERWLAAVYADNAIVTRLGAEKEPRRAGAASAAQPNEEWGASSSAAPTVLAGMLELADLSVGQRVLEIGTGTGWNAALLTHRLGDGGVITVEINAYLAEKARATLQAEGFAPAVHPADGYNGYAPGAFYDRITSTSGVGRLPPAWLDQLNPDGLVVCPWGLLEGAGVITRFECPGDGSALGRFHGGVGFVPLRVPDAPPPPVQDTGQQPDEYRLTQVDPVAPLLSFPSAFALSVMVPDWRVCRRWIGTGSGVWVCDRTGSSWVRVYPYGTSWMIEQGGPRSIWDEFENALDEWFRLGEPRPDAFGLSVDPDGAHRVWLGSPAGRTWTV